MTLFELAAGREWFTLKSGDKSRWKINCDALTDEDWKTLASMAIELFYTPTMSRKHFDVVLSCGGAADRFADALRDYEMGPRHCDREYVLIAEDVVTTGTTIKRVADESGLKRCKGLAVFARGPWPLWVDVLFPLARTRQVAPIWQREPDVK